MRKRFACALFFRLIQWTSHRAPPGKPQSGRIRRSRLLAKQQAAVYNTEKHGKGGGMMLKIAICDDDAGDRERIAEDLRVYRSLGYHLSVPER